MKVLDLFSGMTILIITILAIVVFILLLVLVLWVGKRDEIGSLKDHIDHQDGTIVKLVSINRTRQNVIEYLRGRKKFEAQTSQDFIGNN